MHPCIFQLNIWHMQGGRSWGNAGMALTKRLGLLRNAILSSKAFEELSKKSSSFRKPICFRRVFHESHFAFGEGALLTKIIVMFLELFTKTGVLLPTSATLGTWNIRNQKVLYYTYQVPYKMKFESETLHTCTKLSGKPLQYTKKDKFESIIKFLSARWQLDQNILILKFVSRPASICTPMTALWRQRTGSNGIWVYVL